MGLLHLFLCARHGRNLTGESPGRARWWEAHSRTANGPYLLDMYDLLCYWQSGYSSRQSFLPLSVLKTVS